MTTLNARDTALLEILSSDHNRALILSALGDSEKNAATSTKADVVASLKVALSMTIRYVLSADSHAVLDSVTGLTWSQSGSDERYTFAEAASYIESLNDDEFGGFSDWRLPTDHELCSIVDRSRYNPAIDPAFRCQPNYYWTSMPLASSSGSVWVVYFYNGFVYGDHRYSSAFVRAVRGPSPAGQ